jgi:hypothetical protein
MPLTSLRQRHNNRQRQVCRKLQIQLPRLQSHCLRVQWTHLHYQAPRHSLHKRRRLVASPARHQVRHPPRGPHPRLQQRWQRFLLPPRKHQPELCPRTLPHQQTPKRLYLPTPACQEVKSSELASVCHSHYLLLLHCCWHAVFSCAGERRGPSMAVSLPRHQDSYLASLSRTAHGVLNTMNIEHH